MNASRKIKAWTDVRILNGVAIGNVFVRVFLLYNPTNRYSHGKPIPYRCKILPKKYWNEPVLSLERGLSRHCRQG
jgi:hypothetical protein